MNTEALRSLIKELAGERIFSVDFIKRTTGEPRTMVCRLGVKKGQVGGEIPFDVVEKGLLPVFDLQAASKLSKEAEEKGIEPDMSKAYRMISLESVTELRANGNVYRFET